MKISFHFLRQKCRNSNEISLFFLPLEYHHSCCFFGDASFAHHSAISRHAFFVWYLFIFCCCSFFLFISRTGIFLVWFWIWICCCWCCFDDIFLKPSETILELGCTRNIYYNTRRCCTSMVPSWAKGEFHSACGTTKRHCWFCACWSVCVTFVHILCAKEWNNIIENTYSLQSSGKSRTFLFLACDHEEMMKTIASLS